MRALIRAAGLALASPAIAEAQCYTAREGTAFDFAAGGQTLYQNDFSAEPPGEFPASREFKQGARRSPCGRDGAR